jgi:hypothetical protein
MGTKSRETIYGASIRAAAEQATRARKDADRLASWLQHASDGRARHRAATEDNAGP